MRIISSDSYQGTPANAVHLGYYFMTGLPALTLALFYSCVCHAAIAAGHWPTFNAPDPSDVAPLFQLHYTAVWIVLIVTSVSPLAWLMAIPVANRLSSVKHYAVLLGFYLISFFSMLWIGKTDPGHFINWFLD